MDLKPLIVRRFKPVWRVKFDSCPCCNSTNIVTLYTDDKTLEKRKCKACNTSWCPVCRAILDKQPLLLHRCEDPKDREILEMFLKGIAQPCCACPSILQKAQGGCNNIKCPMCSTNQHWFCKNSSQSESESESDNDNDATSSSASESGSGDGDGDSD